MSSSKKYLDSRRSGKAAEKSNFASTCNLLSQFLREHGKLKALTGYISGNMESIGKCDASQISKAAVSTKNLSTNLADLNHPPIEEAITIIPMEDLPSFGKMISQNNSQDRSNIASTSNHGTSMESKRDQMTILYDGKIWVFDDLPANKAYEVMILASKGNTIKPPINGNLSTFGEMQNNVVSSFESNPRPRLKRGPSTNENKKVEVQLDDDDDNSDDLPIARRSSLHRFLEKRKERSFARESYQFDGDFPGPSSEDDKELELRL